MKTRQIGYSLAALFALLLASLPLKATAQGKDTAPGQQAPTNSVEPSIGGTAAPGESLTASLGEWDGVDNSYVTQWERCDAAGNSCGPVGGADGPTFLLSSDDVGSTLRVVVTATNKNGSALAASGPSDVVTPPARTSVASEPATTLSAPAVSTSTTSSTTTSASTSTVTPASTPTSTDSTTTAAPSTTSTSLSTSTGTTTTTAASDSNVPAPISGLGYNLVFDDEFNGFDSSVWSDHIWYESSVPGTVFAQNGVLHVQTQRATGWQQANASTGGKKTWLYGYFEARMKWTGSAGAWPAFWLFSQAQADGRTSSSLLCSEVDIQEGDGTDLLGFNTALHKNTGSGFGVPDQFSPANNWHGDLGLGDLADSWHTYGLLWTPTKVSWYLDGQQIATATPYANSTNQPMFMLLSMWNGGALSGSATPSAAAPSVIESQFDWVRVWQPAGLTGAT